MLAINPNILVGELVTLLFQVTATDGDKDRPENIVYFLTGQGIDTDRPDQSKFDINKTTGEIFVLKVSFCISQSVNIKNVRCQKIQGLVSFCLGI